MFDIFDIKGGIAASITTVDWPLPNTVRCDLPHGTLHYTKHFVEDSQGLFDCLMQSTPWRRDSIQIMGREQLIPRQQAWIADSGLTYQYSNLTLQPQPWYPALTQLRERVVHHVGAKFNSVLMNLYEQGSNSCGWHADDEPELGKNPLIASLSFGAVRRFLLKPKRLSKMSIETGAQPADPAVPTRNDALIRVDLEPGSLLLMSGPLQHYWRHCLPKTKKPVSPRINCTFRSIVTPINCYD